MRSKLLILLTLMCIGIGTALGQTITVKGVVYDEEKEPVTGAFIRIKSEPNRGTQTDMNGRFTLNNVKKGETLLISFVGYATLEVAAAPSLTINLKPDSEILKEVVVVGYSTRSVANTSASVVKVDAKELESKPTANILDAVSGKVSGVQILTSSGEPSATANVQLHGLSSMRGTTSTPLYILDGMPVTASVVQSMNSNDFESMQFLKDAAATSIYGARAANGVIYIQTKRGKLNERARITVRGQYGVSTLANTDYFKTLMNTEELFRFIKEVGFEKDTRVWTEKSYNGTLKDWGKNNTQWYKYIYRSAPMYQGDLSVSGGGGNTTYYISGGIFDQKGTRYGSSYKKVNLRANINSTLNKLIRMGLNSSISYDDVQTIPFLQGSSRGGGLTVFLAPYLTPYKEDGSEYYEEMIPGVAMRSPRYYVDKSPNSNNTLFLNLSGNATITPFRNFQIRSQVGLNVNHFMSENIALPSMRGRTSGNVSESFLHSNTFSTYNIAEYKFSILHNHNFSALIGQEYTSSQTGSFGASGNGLTDDRLTELSHTTKDKDVQSEKFEYAFSSLFTQLSYDYQNKVFLDLVLRNDASSRFGKNKQNGLFWSVGLLWKAKKENFLKDVDAVDDLDFKFSIGTQGNSNLGLYDAIATAGKSGQYKKVPGLTLGRPGNPDLSWEQQRTINVGISTRLFDRLSLGIEYYNKLNSNMIMDVPVSSASGLIKDENGYISYKSNEGTYLNQGVDISISGDILKGKDYGLSAYANLNINRDKTIKLFQGRDAWVLDKFGFAYVVGQPATFVLPIFKEINPKNGEPVWYLPEMDANNNPIQYRKQMDDTKVTSEYDETRLIQNTGVRLNPPYVGGFGIEGNWKGLSLQADFAFVLGKYMIANDRFFLENPYKQLSDLYTQSRKVFDYWKEPGQIATYPSREYQKANKFGLRLDTRTLENASFMRLKNLTLGYSLPMSLLQKQDVLRGAKFYVSARNLLTFTKYEGMDPETDASTSWGEYPNTRQFSVGLELNF